MLYYPSALCDRLQGLAECYRIARQATKNPDGSEGAQLKQALIIAVNFLLGSVPWAVIAGRVSGSGHHRVWRPHPARTMTGRYLKLAAPAMILSSRWLSSPLAGTGHADSQSATAPWWAPGGGARCWHGFTLFLRFRGGAAVTLGVRPPCWVARNACLCGNSMFAGAHLAQSPGCAQGLSGHGGPGDCGMADEVARTVCRGMDPYLHGYYHQTVAVRDGVSVHGRQVRHWHQRQLAGRRCGEGLRESATLCERPVGNEGLKSVRVAVCRDHTGSPSARDRQRSQISVNRARSPHWNGASGSLESVRYTFT